MKTALRFFVLGLALVLAACGQKPTASVRPENSPSIAWQEGDVSEAFAEAKAERKPVLLYWGAKWCPPCNALKETLFKDPAFVEATKSFIAVHLDGDSKDAQLWGEKFGGIVYPEVIVLKSDQSEVTRLSGASIPSLTAVLKLAAGRTASDRDLLARASANPRSLSPDDWRLLANFHWEADPRFADKAKEAGLLHSLSVSAPDPAIGRRLLFLELIVGQTGEKVRLSSQQQDQLRSVLAGILSNYEETKANEQELSDSAPDLIDALPDAGERARLGDRLVAALDRVADDSTISLADRLDTVSADIALSKAANNGKVAPAVLAKVRRRVAMADRAATNPILRQAVMPEAGDALAEAGDRPSGERLLRAELGRSVAPWYDMSDLARIAEADKDDKAALAWSKKAAESAQGSATRVQWAILYSQAVMRMTPDDHAAVEQAADMVVAALGDDDAGYADRTRRKTAAWSAALSAWSSARHGAPTLSRLRANLARTCGQSACKGALNA